MKVYKLVRQGINDRLISWNETGLGVQVTYTPGMWASAKIKGTPLFAFNAAKAARRFFSALADDETQLWESEAETVRKYYHIAFRQSSHGTRPGWVFRWKGWRKRASCSDKGMLICGKIKLLKQLKLKVK